MRMRDLEAASGVGRETIRFYIREGLLPEPVRARRNSAFYSHTHVQRLKTIKRLKEERFLPLAVIRTLLECEEDEALLADNPFPRLDTLLRAKLEPDPQPKVLETLFQPGGLTEDLAARHAQTGMIAVEADGTVSAMDAAILETLNALSDIGLNDQRGFTPEELKPFVDVIDWLVRHEMKLFFDHMAGKVGETEAADIAVRALSLINQLLAQMHMRAALRALSERRRVANDNADATAMS